MPLAGIARVAASETYRPNPLAIRVISQSGRAAWSSHKLKKLPGKRFRSTRRMPRSKHALRGRQKT